MVDKNKLIHDAELEMLSQAGVENWEYYYDVSEEVENGTDELDAMRGFGVEEWDNYDEALSDLPEYHEYVNSTLEPVGYTEWTR